ncbi:unnamed protein product [Durusdinium trenchii]|uniref:Non-specific serine/threonine protein kinase n=1 Tax=Durusdinium trenchii TaxID=1381693 RepID=A0ABP0JWJ2_9DINO
MGQSEALGSGSCYRKQLQQELLEEMTGGACPIPSMFSGFTIVNANEHRQWIWCLDLAKRRLLRRAFGEPARALARGEAALGHSSALDRAEDLRRLRASNPITAFTRYHGAESGRRLEDDYVLQDNVLGTGMSGSVQLVASTVDGSLYALKIYDKDSMNDSRYKLLKQEVEIYLSVDHPNIARLIDVYEWGQGIALIMEYCSGGELQQRWNSEAYEEEDAMEATKQMLYAVNYLHAHNICHRDLKLENFLYESGDKNASLKLIDFGLSISLDDDEMTMKSTVGTLLYCSPDVISGKAYTSKCDLWSLGVIVFMLLSGRPPFITSMGHERMRKDISRAKVQWDRLENVSAEARDFVHKLLVLDPLQRLDAAAALNHPWLASKDVTQDWDRARAGGHRIKGVLSALKQYMQQSKLHRLLLQLLAQELGNEEAKEMRELFLQIDSDERGTIRLGDLKAAMARRRAPGSPKGMMDMVVGRRLTSPNLSPTNQIPEEQVEQIFSMLDANGDEEVHYSDFLAATVNMRGRWRREALRKIFNRIDRDASGTISVSEVQRVVAETVEDATAAEEFLKESKVTLNSKGEISFEAFADLFERKDLCITGSSPVTRKDMLKACAWDESPHSWRRTFGTALEPTVRCGPTQNVELDLVGSNAVDAAMCDAVQRDAVRGTSGAEATRLGATVARPMISFAALGLALVLAVLLAPQPVSRPTDVRAVCGMPEEEFHELGLPEVTAVNWGQWHGPYALPAERMAICASGKVFVWQRGGPMLQLPSVPDLLPSLLKLWPRDRGSQDGNFLWILDEDYNLVIAPIMQRRNEGGALLEVKHGDLAPGQTFFGRGPHLTGPYRGLARLGGEFNLAGARDGAEWIMHAKSGYTAYRVPVREAEDYFHVQHQAGRNESEIAQNFQRCVYREIYRVRDALSRMFCLLRRHGVRVALGEFRQCDIRSSAAGGFPDLQTCTVKDPGNATACSSPSAEDGPTTLHVIDWYAPGQDRCKSTVADYASMLKAVELDLMRLFQGEPLNPADVQKQIRSLRKHSCLFSREFTDQLHCNVHGCFGDGFTRKLKAVELMLPKDLKEARRLWGLALAAWSSCAAGQAISPEQT